jgi:hypothetical protein
MHLAESLHVRRGRHPHIGTLELHCPQRERTSEAKDSVDAVGWPCVEAVEVNSRYGDRPEGIIARPRAGLLLIVLPFSSVVAVGGSLLWPEPATGDWYSYQDIAPVRELWWGLLTMLSVSLVLNVPAQALAALLLTHAGAPCGQPWAQD